ncbi:hypothetical protein ACFPRL_07660 [Pseudoclavibacter helvolus]
MDMWAWSRPAQLPKADSLVARRASAYLGRPLHSVRSLCESSVSD